MENRIFTEAKQLCDLKHVNISSQSQREATVVILNMLKS